MLKKMTTILFFIGILTACSTSDNMSTENVMSDVDAAIQKNLTLENATYETALITEPEDINQNAEGAFISLGDGEYNWTHTEYLGSERNFNQVAEIDGRQYQLISVDEEGFEAEWQEVEADTHQLNNQISPLLENTLEEEYFDEIEVTEEGGKHYQITLTEAYTENFKAETIQELEELIAELEEAGDETGYIEMLERQIENIESTEYTDPEIELMIDEEGYLVNYVTQYTFTAPDAESVTVTIEFEITAYNLEDTSSLLPSF